MSNEFNIKHGFISKDNSIVNGSLTATTFYGDGSNLTGISSGTFTGGTVTGPTNFTNGLTANTFNTDYIDFNTGVTVSNKTGRVYFDDTEKALSYFPDENDNVNIRIGQQLYSRVYNGSGSLITKGKAVTIQTATSGVPNVTLAIASQPNLSETQVVGLTATDIADGEVGFILNQGLLSGLTINTFNIGDILYLSDTVTGDYVSSTNDLEFSSRTNQIGYVIATGTTEGQIYVSINNEDLNLTLTDKERNILEGNVISTGVYEFTGSTKTSSTTFDVAPARGWIVNNTYEYATLPDVTNVYYSGVTGLTTPYLATADSTYIMLTSGGTLSYQTTYPTPQERRESILLSKVVHPDRTSILLVNNITDYDVSPMSALRDMFTPIKLINEGIIISPNGVNLNINQSAGTLWGMGINWFNNQLDPNRAVISAQSPTTFQYRTQTGTTFTNTTTIDPDNYDVGGVVTNIPGAGKYTTQRIFLFPSGQVRIQYGQTYYNSLAKALAGLPSETFNIDDNLADNSILIGTLTVEGGATDLTDAVFNITTKFGEQNAGTAGLSTTTLQQAYENSVNPEIVINSTLDGLDIQNGTGAADNVTTLIKGKNTAGTTTSIIRADGAFSGLTYYGDGSNLTGIVHTVNTDRFVTGGTYNSGSLTLDRNDGNSVVVTGFLTGNTLQEVLVNGNTSGGNDIIISDDDILQIGSSDPTWQFSKNSVNGRLEVYNTDEGFITQLFDQEYFHSVGISGGEWSFVGPSGYNDPNFRVRIESPTSDTQNRLLISSVGLSASTFSGLTYLTDYSSNFTNRSLVDKEYVDNSGYWSSQTGALVDTNTTISHTTLNTNTNSIIGGGQNNKLDNSDNAVIIGGINNNILSGNTSFIIGGSSNDIQARSGSDLGQSGVLGGSNNNIIDVSSDSDRSFIIGGVNNDINNSGDSIILSSGLSDITSSSSSSIIGSSSSLVTNSSFSSIIGGSNNELIGTTRSVVLGGQNITGTTDDTVYVPNLNIQNVPTGTTVTSLGVDTNGNVIKSNSPSSVAFSPINVGICDTAPTAASTQYYYQTIAEATMTISKAKLWGYSGSNTVLFGIYRGTLPSSTTLIGQGSVTAGIGPNEITLTAEVGQTLDVTAGENIVVGFYTSGTSWRTVYDTGISDTAFGISNTANIGSMPASPTGTATAIRFALTLY